MEIATAVAPEPNITIELLDRADPSEIGPLWIDLERRSDCSFYQTWAWIGCWLRQLPHRFRPQAIVARVGDETVGLGIFNSKRKLRHRMVFSKGLYLGQTGEPDYDHISIEHNGFLVDRTMEETVTRRCIEGLAALGEDQWSEFFVSGVNASRAALYRQIAADLGFTAVSRRRAPYHIVDLEAIRQGSGDYLQTLSRNTRYQVRRAVRLYQDDGALTLDTARDLDQAFAYFADLGGLHQSYWRSKGQTGSFAFPFWKQFHEALIEERFDAGEIQLVRVAAGDQSVGYLYNFVKDAVVYCCQSGFTYDADPKRKPGLVCHALAIQHNLEQEAKVYDFLAGEGQHKQSLCTYTSEMDWLVIRRDYLRFRIEDRLRSWKHRAVRLGSSSLIARRRKPGKTARRSA